MTHRLSGYPETSYLDNARLSILSADAADATALYMFLLLYRQLVHSESTDPPPSPQDLSKVDHADLLRLKSEIRDIGSARLGYCFSAGPSSNEAASPQEKNAEKEQVNKQDIVLQIAKRAKEAASRASGASSPLEPFSPVADAPDEQMVNLAQRWADSNIRANSPLGTMLQRRLRDVVFNCVVKLAYPGRDSTTGNLSDLTIDLLSFTQAATSPLEIPFGTATGMEPLVDEIRSLAERISRLALIHLNAYLPLYEQDGFLD